MRETILFLVPYDSGIRDGRMGAGPARLRAMLVEERTQEIISDDPFPAEIKTTFELYRRLADAVAAREPTSFPIVLAGNCGACAGTASGLGVDDLAVIWLDAHGDFMTPDTTVTGYLDGMGASLLTGRCWQSLTSSIRGFRPLPANRLLHIGGRDYSPGEEASMVDAGVMMLGPAALETQLASALDELRTRASRVLIHLDVDVIDPRFGIANRYAAPGGISPDDVKKVIDGCAERFEIAAFEVASYDPEADENGGIGSATASIIRHAIGAVITH